MTSVAAEESCDGFGAAIEKDLNVGIASGPDITEEHGAGSFSEWDERVAEFIEGLAEGLAPELIKTGRAAVASAVGTPTLYAVSAAPGSVFDYFAFVLGRKLFEEAAVVDERDGLVLFEQPDRVGEGHFAVAMMMSVRFTVRGDVDELRQRAVIKAGLETCGECFAGVEQAFKGNGS